MLFKRVWKLFKYIFKVKTESSFNQERVQFNKDNLPPHLKWWNGRKDSVSLAE